jgi:hypothetical protein
VRNTLPDVLPQAAGDGIGLSGMAARAEQMGARLRTGVDADCWLVELHVPADAGVVAQ